MSTLLLGGRGKTSIKIATLLAEAKVPFALASRSKSDGCKYQQVEFDWQKRNTYGIPFDTVSPPIKAIYIVMPPDGAIDPVKEFIGVARGRGVGRFVLLSSSAIEAGGPAHGQIHQYLMALGVEWAVLRPSWFMENFLQQDRFDQSENELYSAAGDGKVPWISATDIASVGFRCLVDTKSHDTDHVIVGPQLLSYDEIANILSEVLGRKIKHKRLSVADMSARFQSLDGITAQFAEMLSCMDDSISKGSENSLNDEVEKVTGKPPQSFRSWAEANRSDLE